MKHSIITRSALLGVLALTGCVTFTKRIYVNAHPERHDFDQDRFACLEASAKATPPAVITSRDVFGAAYQSDVNSDPREVLMEACMKAREWSLVDAGPGQ